MTKFLELVDRYVRTIDYALLVLALVCSGFGLVLIYSAAYSLDAGSARYMTVQTLAIAIGIIGFVAASCIRYERYVNAWKIVLVINIIFQLSLIVLGSADGGNKSWIRFGGIGIQPAEIGKLLFIFSFARQINIYRFQLNKPRNLAYLGAQLVAMLLAIILPSHDVGVALSYIIIAIVMLFAAGLSLKWFAGGIVLCCAAVPILWQVLSTTQKNRILVLFDPSIAPDTYYQQEQSRIAIGAGKLFGQGYLSGSQTQYNMLPEKQTDFIFGVAGEEWGLIGCLVILILLNLLIIRIFYVCYKANGQFLSLICAGVGAMFLYQTYENIFMCLGIGPVMGLTLPFFSYGGTSIVTMYLAVGMVAGISMRAKQRKQARLAGAPIDDDVPPIRSVGLNVDHEDKKKSPHKLPKLPRQPKLADIKAMLAERRKKPEEPEKIVPEDADTLLQKEQELEEQWSKEEPLPTELLDWSDEVNRQKNKSDDENDR